MRGTDLVRPQWPQVELDIDTLSRDEVSLLDEFLGSSRFRFIRLAFCAASACGQADQQGDNPPGISYQYLPSHRDPPLSL
jgi:hypothetical protein